MLRRCLRLVVWSLVVAIYAVHGTLGSTSGREKSLLLLATVTPAGAVFLLGGVVVALTTLPHIEQRGKP
jgi:hypothetical protein